MVKTSLLHRYIGKAFQGDLIGTAGVDFMTKDIQSPDAQERVTVQLWDTAGQERFHKITHSY